MNLSPQNLLNLPHGTQNNLIFHELTCNLDSNRKSFAFLNASSHFASIIPCIVVLSFILSDQTNRDMSSRQLKNILKSCVGQLVDCSLGLAMIRRCEWHGRGNQQINLTSGPLLVKLLLPMVPLFKQQNQLQCCISDVIKLLFLFLEL